MNTINDLVVKCDEFLKLAQPNPKVIKQFIKNLSDTLFRVAAYLPSQYAAKQLFEKMRIYNEEAPHSAQPKFQDEASNLKRFLTLLEFYRDHGPAYGIIIEENYRKPLNALIFNIRVILEAQDFSKYQQFTLLHQNEQPTIDMDEWAAQNSPYGR